MPVPWVSSVRARSPKQLTVFITPTISAAWKLVCNEALAEFNRLAALHGFGVTLAAPTGIAAPSSDNLDGADIKFDTGDKSITFTALGATRTVKPFDGTGMHGYTGIVKVKFGTGPLEIAKAFVFVPVNPTIQAAKHVGPKPDDFRYLTRSAGNAIRRFIVVHEFIHACGLDNNEHNQMGPDADVFCGVPDSSAGAFDKPDDDKILLHLAAPKPNVFAPPITLKKKTIDLIKDNWK